MLEETEIEAKVLLEYLQCNGSLETKDLEPQPLLPQTQRSRPPTPSSLINRQWGPQGTQTRTQESGLPHLEINRRGTAKAWVPRKKRKFWTV